jgi:hypothetical protein
VNVTLPLVRLFEAETNVPLLNCTVPVGVPLEPATVTVTTVPCALVMLEGDALTVTVAVAVPVVTEANPFTTLVTFSEPSPVASS